MSRAVVEPDWPRVAALIELARRQGRHSSEVKAVCHVCREWCDGHYYGTESGVDMCGACADKIGKGPRAVAAARGVR